jgi:rare lipoprotein A
MDHRGRIVRAALTAAACGTLAACASTPTPTSTVRSSAQAAPAAVGKVGRPYQVNGRWYAPAHQPDYEEVGQASWYGGAHQGKPTAMGEPFDKREISAAHKTLPLPSLVEVVNLENGRRLTVRVNDRGPFAHGRIIDLSEAAAEQLGFKTQGVARVRVRYLGGASGGEQAQGKGRRASEGKGDPEWIVQAAAFADPENARRAADSLVVAGRTSVRPSERKGGVLYRVVVGPWEAEGEARAAQRRVSELGFRDAKVVAAF